MTIKILAYGKQYKVCTRKLKTNSNYNIGIHLYEDNDLLIGTTLKSTSKSGDFIQWANEKINQLNN